MKIQKIILNYFIFLILFLLFFEKYLSISLDQSALNTESLILYEAMLGLKEFGIPRTVIFENSSVGWDIINYISFARSYIDLQIVKIFDLTFANFNYVYLFEYCFFILIIYLYSYYCFNNDKLLILIFLTLIYFNLGFIHLLRNGLSYGITLNLLAIIFFFKFNSHKNIFFTSIIFTISLLFEVMIGLLFLISYFLFLILYKKSIKNIILFFLGILLIAIIFLINLSINLEFIEIKDFIKILYSYLSNYLNFSLDPSFHFIKILRNIYIILYSNNEYILLLPTALILLSLLLIKNNINNLDKNLIEFSLCLTLIFIILSLLFPEHYLSERYLFIYPLVLGLFIKFYKKIYYNKYGKTIIHLSFLFICINFLFNFLATKFLLNSILFQFINLLALIILLIFLNKNYNYFIKILKNKIILFFLIFSTLITSGFTNKKLNIYNNIDYEIEDSYFDLKYIIHNFFENNITDLNIITNYPVREIFPSNYKLNTLNTFQEHNPRRRLLWGIPSMHPDYLVIIINKQSSDIGFVENLERFNKMNNNQKNIFNFNNHKSVYVKGYSFELLKIDFSGNFQINYYKKSKINYSQIDFYMDIFNPEYYFEYLKNLKK